MSKLAAALHHLKTVNHHKALVLKHCWKVGLYKQGITHDLSKFSPTEFKVGINYYQGTRSPNTAERAEKGYSTAWLHHKGRNKHHYEYWIDIKGNMDAAFEGKPMPTRYVVEMFCDRVAASKVYKGDKYTDATSLEYFRLEQSCGEILMHPDTKALLERMLVYLAENGEDKTFHVIRKYVVKARHVESDRTHFSD